MIDAMLADVWKYIYICLLFRMPADPSLALQRSRSSFHLKESRESDSGKDLPWGQDLQGMLGSLQDTSFNRSVSSKSESFKRSGSECRILEVTTVFHNSMVIQEVGVLT